MPSRLRQVALVAADLEVAAAALREGLGLGEPFRDPGVAEFGLHNVVFAVGDTFLEIVSPLRAGTTAGRLLDKRGGDGGYMAIFQVEDTAAAREAAGACGVRIVWQVDLPDISGTHFHPKDVPGAIVSVDTPRPPGTWRWGGPAWTGQVPPHPEGGITGVTVEVPDPDAARAVWDRLVGLPAGVSFVPGERGIVEVEVSLPGFTRDIEVSGVRIRVPTIGGQGPRSSGDRASVS